MLENLTVDQLKEKAKGIGIAGVSSMNKAALISAILAHESEGQSNNQEPKAPPVVENKKQEVSGMGSHKKFDKFKK